MLTKWHCLQSSAARCYCSNNQYLLPAGPTAANLWQRVCCCGPCWDRQTDKHRTVSQTLLRIICRQCQQEMMKWQWYWLDHTQIIWISLHTDNHTALNIQLACNETLAAVRWLVNWISYMLTMSRLTDNAFSDGVHYIIQRTIGCECDIQTCCPNVEMSTRPLPTTLSLVGHSVMVNITRQCFNQSLGMQENRGIAIIMNTVILGMCHDFWPSPWFCITALIIGGLWTKPAQWSFSDANLALH